MGRLKISYPEVRQPAFVTFGPGSVRVVAESIPLERSAFLVSGRPNVRETLARAWRKQGLDPDEAQVFVKPTGEPTRETIASAAAFLGHGCVDHLVAVGGGSVLDLARLAWAVAEGLLDLDTAGVQETTPNRPAIWLVPTTCGSGAEAAAIAVFSDAGTKRAIIHRAFIADRVVLDAHFLDTVPPAMLACSVCDATSHAVEAYLSIVPSQLAKEAALSALALVLKYFHDTTEHQKERLMEAGYLGGIAAGNCGVGVVHAFAHALSRWGFRHGHANALGLLAGIAANAPTPAMGQLCDRLGLHDAAELSDQIRPIVHAALQAPDTARAMELLAVPGERQRVVEGMTRDVCMRTNPRPFTLADFEAFLDRVAATAAAA